MKNTYKLDREDVINLIRGIELLWLSDVNHLDNYKIIEQLGRHTGGNQHEPPQWKWKSVSDFPNIPTEELYEVYIELKPYSYRL